MMSSLKIRIVAAILAIIGIAALIYQNNSLRNQKKRLEQNQTALLSKISSYKTDSARSAVSISQLRLTTEELKESNLSLLDDIEELNIKLKRVNAASSVNIESNYDIKAEVKDSVIVRDSIVYKYKCIDYKNPYIILQGCIVSPTVFEGKIKTFNSITRVEHRVPKKFLFFRFGTKLVKEEYLCSNPYSEITDVQTVVIVDKEGNKK